MIAGADQAQAMCAAKLYDVLMPDIKYCGGKGSVVRPDVPMKFSTPEL